MSEVSTKKEFILESSYESIPISTITSPNACHYFLSKAEENTRNGKINWVTNSITGETITYADVEPMSKKVANALRLRGMKKGDIAMYMSSNVTQTYLIFLGVWRLGAVMYSSYPGTTKDTFLERILEANIKWIFCDIPSVRQCLAALATVDWPVEVFVFGEFDGCTSVITLFEPLVSDHGSHPVSYTWEHDIVQMGMDDPVLILNTSGSTGKNKAVVYTSRNILAFCMARGGGRPEPMLVLSHCANVLGCLMALRNIVSGSWGVMMHQVIKENVFNAIEMYKPFLIFGEPFYLMSLFEDPGAKALDKRCIEFVCTVGGLMEQNVYTTLMKLPNLKGIANGYGMTECVTIAIGRDFSAPAFNILPDVPALSVGRLYPNTSLKILDLDTKETLGPKGFGEVVIKSPVLCSEYFKNPEESAKAFRDGWMHTGDCGYYDENGFIFITGRLTGSFKYLSNHILPEELEAVFLKHEGVAEVCVYGVAHEGGKVPRAAVVLKKDVSITAEEIQHFVEDQVPLYKYIRGGVYFVESLPRGNTGKVLRTVVATASLGCEKL